METAIIVLTGLTLVAGVWLLVFQIQERKHKKTNSIRTSR
jgi:hypothetical protein